MQVIARPFGEPGFDRGRLVGGVVVDDEVDVESGRHGRIDGVEEASELAGAMSSVAAAEHVAGGDIKRGEQRRRAVALVVVAASLGLAERERQQRLGAIERLDLMGWMAPYRHGCAIWWLLQVTKQEPPTMQITTIGLDLAKHIFQVHAVDGDGIVVEKRRLRRAQVLTYFAKLPACLVGMEACATAHFWARELRSLGHDVRLVPPQYVKPYVRRGKNDAADAAAICEAVSRPCMRFVPIKSEEQQSLLVMHRARDLLVRQRTQLINAIRGHLAEFGLIRAQGVPNVVRLLNDMHEDAAVPEHARVIIELFAEQLGALGERIDLIERRIAACHKASAVSQRLATIPGIGPIIATAITATVADPSAFRSGREFAAWLGLTPTQRSTGGKQRLGRISRKGDQYIRRLLIIGAQTVLLRSKAAKANPWIQNLLARCPRLKVAVALANKMAGIAWAVMAKGEPYRQIASA
jgi:transposase